MKKKVWFYIIFWIALVSLFNVLCFVTPNEINGVNKFSGAFWSGYGFTMVSFIGHLVYSCIVFSEKNLDKRVMNTPLTVISFIELGFMIIVGAICMVVPGMPTWIGIAICYMVLILSVITLVCVNAVGKKTMQANVVLNQKTSLFREFIDKAQELTNLAKTAETKALFKKIYDAIRYSDLVSSDATEDEEEQIGHLLDELRNEIAVTDEIEILEAKVDRLLNLIEIRNNKCKAMKRHCD